MPLPFKPSELCALVPSATSNLCDRIEKVFLRLPKLLCDFYNWMFNADGTLSTNFLNEVNILPPGIVVWRPSTIVPAGWLSCNGQEVSRTDFAALFAVIGTQFGAGNGTTSFNLPNLKRKFLTGYDPNDGAYGMGASGGEENHTLTIAEVPAHAHPRNLSGFTEYALLTADVGDTPGGSSTGGGTKLLRADTTGNAGGGQAHNNVPPYVAGAYLIKT